MTADTILSLLSAIVGALGVGLQAIGQAMLANTAAAEWTLAAALAGAAWLISLGRGWRASGVLVFLVAVIACTWLSWKLGRHGALAQQAVMAAMILHGTLRARGYARHGDKK